MPTLYIVCGPSAIGKSTWIEKHHAPGTAVVSRDKIRFAKVKEDEPYFSKEPEVYAEFVAVIATCLNHGTDTYADATHLTRKSRKKLVKSIKRKLRNPEDLEVVAINFGRNRMLHHCNQHNKNRTGREFVAKKIIIQQIREYERPDLELEPYLTDIIQVYAKDPEANKHFQKFHGGKTV